GLGALLGVAVLGRVRPRPIGLAGIGGPRLGQFARGLRHRLFLALAAVRLGAALVDRVPALALEDVEALVERVEGGLGRGLGEIDRGLDLLLGLVSDLLDLALAEDALPDTAPGEGLDRVLLAPLVDLLALAVDLGVGGGVAAVAVGEGLEQRRPA